jgi:hypothetical protein
MELHITIISESVNIAPQIFDNCFRQILRLQSDPFRVTLAAGPRQFPPGKLTIGNQPAG